MSDSDFTDFDPDEMSGPGWTVTRAEEGRGRFIRQSADAPKFGEVTVVVAPHRGTHCFRFVWRPPLGHLPKPFMRGGCLKGVREALNRSLPDGRRIAFVEVSVIGGSYHETDTDELALTIATSLAVQDALKRSTLVAL